MCYAGKLRGSELGLSRPGSCIHSSGLELTWKGGQVLRRGVLGSRVWLVRGIMQPGITPDLPMPLLPHVRY
eukprot:619785-Rhodomonas_salina.7